MMTPGSRKKKKYCVQIKLHTMHKIMADRKSDFTGIQVDDSRVISRAVMEG